MSEHRACGPPVPQTLAPPFTPARIPPPHRRSHYGEGQARGAGKGVAGVVEDARLQGKSPVDDPAQRRLVERELEEQQNPYKTPPNKLTTIDKAVDAGSRPVRLHTTELLQEEDRDRFEA